MTLVLTFIVLMLLGVPVGFVLIGTSLIYILFVGDVTMIYALPQLAFSSLEIFDLLAIPLFVLLGEIMNEGGITRRLLDAAKAWLHKVRRSLAYVNLVTNLMLASILGSANAQIAIMGRVAVPEMERAGYDRGFAAGLTAAAGLLGPIVPPSMVFIVYAVLAQASIGSMFLGGIIPGLLLFAAIGALIWFMPSAAGAETTAAPPPKFTATRNAAAALLVPVMIVIGILSGAVTPTESAAVAVLIALLVGAFVYGELRFAQAPGILWRTAANSATVMFLIAAARIFGWLLTYYAVPQQAAAFLQTLTSDPTVFLLLVFAMLLFVGCVLEGIAALIILVPILLPVARGVYHIDPIHFGIVMCLTLILGLVTPPVGTGLYIAAAVANVDIMRLSRIMIPFILATALVILIVIFVPQIVTLRF